VIYFGLCAGVSDLLAGRDFDLGAGLADNVNAARGRFFGFRAAWFVLGGGWRLGVLYFLGADGDLSQGGVDVFGLDV